MNKYVIGIDTGGTFTDGVLLQYRTRKVVQTTKTLTTHGDLKKGIIKAIEQLKLDDNYDIRLVGISSTLATNSIAEGKACRVGLLLIGYDQELIEQYSLHKKFATEKIAYFKGGHNAQGNELAELDEKGINSWMQENRDQVDAIAVSSYFSPLNHDHENKVFDIISQVSDLPVVLGHQLSTKIDSVKRAATASINASLVAVMQEFIEAVRNSLKNLSIKAPLMIVRGDGTLMPYTEAVQKPVETVLSGPAASAIGGRFLSQHGKALVIDVGSTTTDMALVKDSRVVVSEEGARVGDTETAVKAANIRTVPIGCDSRIWLDKYKKIHLGPDKVTPISQLAMRFPEIKHEVKALKNKPDSGIYFSDIEYWMLYGKLDEVIYDQLSKKQQRVIELIKDRPVSLTKILKAAGVYHSSHLNLQPLIKQGYIECATITPSDLLHVEDHFKLWSKGAAKSALDYIIQIPKINRAKFIEQTLDKIIAIIVEEIMVFLAMQDFNGTKMPEKIDGKWGRWFLKENITGDNDFLAINFDSRVPIIGTGAPAEFFIKYAAEHLKAPFVLPHHYEVANAIGAVSGSIMETIEALVFNQQTADKHTYIVQVKEMKKHFEEFDEACDFAEEKAHEEAKKAAIIAGATDPYVEIKERKEGSLLRYIARAVGNPQLSTRHELEKEMVG